MSDPTEEFTDILPKISHLPANFGNSLSKAELREAVSRPDSAVLIKTPKKSASEPRFTDYFVDELTRNQEEPVTSIPARIPLFSIHWTPKLIAACVGALISVNAIMFMAIPMDDSNASTHMPEAGLLDTSEFTTPRVTGNAEADASHYYVYGEEDESGESRPAVANVLEQVPQKKVMIVTEDDRKALLHQLNHPSAPDEEGLDTYVNPSR